MDELVNKMNIISINSFVTKKWIKEIDFTKTIKFDNYNNKDYFIHVANVEIDNELNKHGKKRRNTVIKFISKIDTDEFGDSNEWIYIFVINKHIVKIGGTRTGLKGRVASYLCGHHIPERGKSGDCSKTNGFIYNTFDYYLQKGYSIQMYGYKLPTTEYKVTILNKDINIQVQTFHAYETSFLEDFKKQYNNYPWLNDNCDPNYK